ncbi:TraR/DksA family transcriptional regulator [Nioella aestuarii]|uniref:TraR/DksA family transcriptional regulator n=1 Tax=Nioella aestuarii TaxID=1662864 RepID=UPI003D7FB6EC
MLEAECAALQRSSSETAEGRKPVELDQTSIGRLSRQDALQGQAMASALEARRHGRLRAIAAACARIEEEEYGWCEDCGEFIGFPRLDVDPCAVRCVSCAT